MGSGRGGHRTWRRSSWPSWHATRRSRRRRIPGQRYEARSLRMWWTPDKGMLQLHGQLPDVLGATFEATIQKLTEQRKPAKGQAWDSFDHRAADALVSLCEQPEVRDETPTLAPRPVVQSTLSRCRARQRSPGYPSPTRCWNSCEPTPPSNRYWSTTTAPPSRSGNASPPCPPRSCGRCCSTITAVRSAAAATDSRSTTSDPAPGAAPTRSPTSPRCAPPAHPALVPHGPYALVGNPNQPGDLHTVHLDDLSPEQRQQIGLPPPRAGPTAA